MLAATPAPLPSGRTDYRDFGDYTTELAQLAAAHPDRVRTVVIGSSREGRPLEGVEIAADVAGTDDGRPVDLVTGLIHAREWTSGEMVMEFAHQLADDDSPRFVNVRARTRTFLFPVMNPDGFVISRTTEPLRRTNAAGVDLNRNFGAFWGGPDGSDAAGSERYRGPRPFSEPESRALRDFSASHQVAVADIVHSYGGTVLYQPGFRRTSEPHLPAGRSVPGARTFIALAKRMAAAARYTAAPASEPSDITGAAEDGIYFNQFASAFTIEVGYRTFQPPFADAAAQYPGVGGALLLAAEATADRSTHAVLEGSAPAGATLRLRRTVRYTTSRVVTGTDGPDPRTGRARTLTQRYASSLTVPATGRFTWSVNPSERPLALLAGKREVWHLACGRERRRIFVERGDIRHLSLRCSGSRSSE